MTDSGLLANRNYHALVIGVSAGALPLLELLLPEIPLSCPIPIIIAMHTGKNSVHELLTHLNEISQLQVCEAETDSPVKEGTIYFAPPDYHLMVEPGCIFSLSMEDEVNYSRPSIDILFETSAQVYRHQLIGLILTGANNDGTVGMAEIKRWGGLTLVQDSTEAYAREMPQSVIQNISGVQILSMERLKLFFHDLPEYCEKRQDINNSDTPCGKYNSK